VRGEFRVEPFDRARHHRQSFDCGVPALNEFFQIRLGQHSRRGIARGYVLLDADRTVAGYFTLSAGRLSVGAIPQGHGFPLKVPLPRTLIGRLAVDVRYRGRGLGGVLLVEALRLAVGTAALVASAVVEVDAKDDRSRAFYSKYGFASLPDDPNHMFLPTSSASDLVRGRSSE
jgi:GNAT superfamily N-acetyltransferase